MIASLLNVVAELSAEQSRSVLFWSSVLIALIFVLFFAYTQLKRWISDPEESKSVGFSLSDIREMHRQGKMTDAEYEVARAKMVSSAKKMTQALPDVLGPKRTPPAAPNPPQDTV